MEEKTKHQLIGSAYVLSLLIFVISIDKIINLEFDFCGNLLESVACVLSAVLMILLLIYIKWKEQRERKAIMEVGKGSEFVSRSLKDKIVILVSNSCSGSILDILTVISYIAFLSWLPDSVTDFIKGDGVIYRPIPYLVGLALLAYGSPGGYLKKEKIPNEKRRFLVTGMSNICINSNNETNLASVIMPFEVYPNFDTIMVLLSDSVLRGLNELTVPAQLDGSPKLANELQRFIDTLKSNVHLSSDLGKIKLDKAERAVRIVEEALETLLIANIREKYPAYRDKKFSVIFTKPVDYDDFDTCNNVCFNEIKHIMNGAGYKGKYKDEEMVINTTPGTKVVASALTINAIKGNRAMVYITQGKESKVEETNPNVTLIQFNELMDERDKI